MRLLHFITNVIKAQNEILFFSSNKTKTISLYVGRANAWKTTLSNFNVTFYISRENPSTYFHSQFQRTTVVVVNYATCYNTICLSISHRETHLKQEGEITWHGSEIFAHRSHVDFITKFTSTTRMSINSHGVYVLIYYARQFDFKKKKVFTQKLGWI